MKDEIYISHADELREILIRMERSIELTIQNRQSLTDGINDVLGEIDNIMENL